VIYYRGSQGYNELKGIKAMAARKNLTAKQQAFIGYYCDPESETVNNGYQSAIKAGYAHNTANNADKLILGNSGVLAEVKLTRAVIRRKAVKTRVQRQEWWTSVVDDTNAAMPDRIRCSELLGRSEADFTDNIANTVEDQTKTLTNDEQIEALRDQIRLLDGTKDAGTAVAV
jgi:phage terminase small subunit